MDDLQPHALFLRSLNPMLITDDERRYVDANAAACLFLRLPREAIRKLTIDDLTPPQRREDVEFAWSTLLERGVSKGGRSVPWDMQMPDGTIVQVDISCEPSFRPGRHLVIIMFPPARVLNERLDHAKAPVSTVLTKREREVLTLVALGNTGLQIADRLFVAPATVATHVTNALIKLGAKNRAHGIAIALQAGEIDPALSGMDPSPADRFGLSERRAATVDRPA